MVSKASDLETKEKAHDLINQVQMMTTWKSWLIPASSKFQFPSLINVDV